MTTKTRKPASENCRFSLISFGCKVNQCDSAGLAWELMAWDWRAADAGTVPDLALVNTCTVTARADQQARQAIRRLARLHPALPIWVTGCYAQRAATEVAALPGVQAVFGNQEKMDLPPSLINCLTHRGFAADYASPGQEGERVGGESLPLPGPAPGEPGPGLWVKDFSGVPPLRPWRVQPVPGHTRAWLKIQEGCSHHCRYCIVPRVRGPRRSLAPAAVLGAFEDLADLGYQEVVLTGVDLGQYGLDHRPPIHLAALVRRLAQIPWPFRIRLSSLEPMMVTAVLLDELAAWKHFCPHFHLPLQSGAAPVLAAMGRPYGPEEFRDLVQDISRRFINAGLGLDVLVGFPGESAADFETTRSLVEELPATYLHVFPYSPRPGTPAAELTPLPGAVIRDRARIMRELGQAKKQRFLETQVGQVREVLVEGPARQPGWLQGLSDHYLRVVLPGPSAWRNRRVMVRLRSSQGETLSGEAVDDR